MALWLAVCQTVVEVGIDGSGRDLVQQVRCSSHPYPYPCHPCRGLAEDHGQGLVRGLKGDRTEELAGSCEVGSVVAVAASGRRYRRWRCERWQVGVPWEYDPWFVLGLERVPLRSAGAARAVSQA